MYDVRLNLYISHSVSQSARLKFISENLFRKRVAVTVGVTGYLKINSILKYVAVSQAHRFHPKREKKVKKKNAIRCNILS